MKEEGRRRIRKRVETFSGVLVEGAESFLTKTVCTPNLDCEIHQDEAGAAPIIQAGTFWKVMSSCHIN